MTAPAEVAETAVVGLLAGALAALEERGWVVGDYTDDDTGRVDVLGALRLAAGVHPRELPADPATLAALLDAEDALAVAIGADPTVVDAGETVAAWQDTASIGAVRGLLRAVLAVLGASR